MKSRALLLLLVWVLCAPVPAAPSTLKKVTAQNFFPGSNHPQAVRERLANHLLGHERVTDPVFDDYYRRVAARLSPADDFLLVTAADQQVNAFAHYGGLIVLMRGMWEFAENEDALLGIIAHEMGHVKLDHFEATRRINETVTAISVPLLIAGLLVGSEELRESIIVGGSGIITGQIYAHSRELEHEADVVGLDLLTEHSRDGRQLAVLLGNLAGTPNEYISTHPAPRRRAAYIKDRLLSKTTVAAADSTEFLLLRQKLSVLHNVSAALIADKQRALSGADGAQKTALQYGLLLAAIKTGDKALAEQMEAALAASEHPFVIAARAAYISRSGDHRRALAMLKTARRAHPQMAALAVQQAMVLREAKQNAELLEMLDELPEAIKNRADILREAARAASALARHAEANLLLARAHIAQGAFELAAQQLEIAGKFKMDTKMLVQVNTLHNVAKRELAALGEE